MTISHPKFLEFVAPGVSKGRAVRWLSRRLRVPLGATLAVGDQWNDFEMLQEVGHGAAMPAAPAGVQAVARYIAPPVEDEGVAAMIEQLVLAKPVDALRRLATVGGGGAPAAEGQRVTARIVAGRRRRSATRRIAVLRAGGLVALPTDTVYGIGVALDTPGGIERLFEAKRRPTDRAVMLLLADADQAGQLGAMTPASNALAAARWPGGLTLVLAQRPDRPLPDALTGGAATIGLRVPAHDAPRALARALGPLPVTSANLSGGAGRDGCRRDRGRARRRRSISSSIGGPAAGGPPSTVVDCSGRSIRGSSREGAIATTPWTSRAILDARRASHTTWEDSQRGRRRRAWEHGGRGQEGVGDSMTISESRGLAMESIAELDPVLWEAMEGERHRQHDKIELIASENYVSAAVMEAQGSWLTNKYAEGLPGKRYYGGCEFVDIAEDLARDRALALFPGAEHVNVQPHSGAQANMAAYFSVLQPGDRILGMNLAHGGHLTHGMALNFSGKLYEVHAYGVRQDTERIDYDAMAAQAEEVRPRLIVAGASAYPRTWDFERMAAIAHGVGAILFVDMAHVAGLVAAGVHRARSRTPTSSRRRPTRPCAGRAAA